MVFVSRLRAGVFASVFALTIGGLITIVIAGRRSAIALVGARGVVSAIVPLLGRMVIAGGRSTRAMVDTRGIVSAIVTFLGRTGRLFITRSLPLRAASILLYVWVILVSSESQCWRGISIYG